MKLTERLSHAWNAFQNKDPTPTSVSVIEHGYFTRPDRRRLSVGADNTIISSIWQRIAIDVASVKIEHVKVDENENFVEKMKDSSLNYIFSTEANIDQPSKEFIRDIVISMFDEGCVALVPTDTNTVPKTSGAFEIDAIRTGKITQWYPKDVEIEVYNEKTGEKEKIKMPKRTVGIIENPLYAVMNGENSTLRRLIRKLSLLDQVDEQSSSGKLDLIIQLPYIIKSEARKQQAEQRRKEIEDQLTNSKYGIAYTDGTEKIVQLGHPIENNLLTQIEYLTKLLYSQLGLTDAVFNGTASEEEMKNYIQRTVEPIVSAITDECQRKFLTKTGRTQGQRVTYFIDPFKLVGMKDLADLANSLTRNEIVTANEIRSVIGFRPSSDPRANQLINSNINPNDGSGEYYEQYPEDYEQFANDQYSQMENIDSELEEMRGMYHSALAHTGANEPPGGYASKYYDPEKAHEYYEKHKKLVGRRSNKGLNEEGIAVAEYMRKQVDDEHERELTTAADQSRRQIEQIDTDLETTCKNISDNLDIALENVRNSTEENIQTAKARLQTVISNSTARIQNQVEQLKAQMANSPSEAARRGYENQIETLQETNSKNRDALSEQFAEEYASAKANYSNQVTSLTEKAQQDTETAKEKNKTDRAKVMDSYKKISEALEEKYSDIMAEEMEKIRNNPAFQEETSSRGSGRSSTRRALPGNYLSNIQAYLKRNRR